MLPSKLITPAVAEFVSTWLGYISPESDYPISKYVEMVRSHPKLAIASELRMLFSLSLMRDYTHPDEAITEEVRASFNNMKGSWRATQLRMMQYLLYGFGFCEKVYTVKQKKATLQTIHALNQEYCLFQGTTGGIESVVYKAPGIKEATVPYENGIHFVNQDYLLPGNSPYGIPLLERAVPYWNLHKIIMAALTVAVQRQATPIVALKTNVADEVTLWGANGQRLVNSDGSTMTTNRGQQATEELKRLENTSVFVMDRADELVAIAQQTDGQFFRSILYYLDATLLWCFLISPVIAGTNESGVGDSSLIQGHIETLKIVSRSQMQIFGDILIENLVRPMLEFNHGAMEDYGSFPVPEDESESTIDLLDAITSAVQRGALSAEDEAVVERVKKLSGIG